MTSSHSEGGGYVLRKGDTAARDLDELIAMKSGAGQVFQTSSVRGQDGSLLGQTTILGDPLPHPNSQGTIATAVALAVAGRGRRTTTYEELFVRPEHPSDTRVPVSIGAGGGGDGDTRSGADRGGAGVAIASSYMPFDDEVVETDGIEGASEGGPADALDAGSNFGYLVVNADPESQDGGSGDEGSDPVHLGGVDADGFDYRTHSRPAAADGDASYYFASASGTDADAVDYRTHSRPAAADADASYHFASASGAVSNVSAGVGADDFAVVDATPPPLHHQQQEYPGHGAHGAPVERRSSSDARDELVQFPGAMKEWTPAHVATFLISLNAEYSVHMHEILGEKFDGECLAEASEDNEMLKDIGITKFIQRRAIYRERDQWLVTQDNPFSAASAASIALNMQESGPRVGEQESARQRYRKMMAVLFKNDGKLDAAELGR